MQCGFGKIDISRAQRGLGKINIGLAQRGLGKVGIYLSCAQSMPRFEALLRGWGCGWAMWRWRCISNAPTGTDGSARTQHLQKEHPRR